MLYKREEALNILGHLCNNLSLIRDKRYNLNLNDFDDPNHRVIFGVLNALSLENDISVADGFVVDTYLKKFPVQHETFIKYKGIELVNNIKIKCSNTSFVYSYKTLKKFSLLRKYKLVGMDIKEIFDENSIDAKKIQEQQLKLDKMSIEEIKLHFKNKLIEVDKEFQTKKDAYTVDITNGLENLLSRCKEGFQWGKTFQSKLFNSVLRGMRGSRLMIRSGNSGTGKSRQSIGDMCNIACSERYIPSEEKWVKNSKVEDVTFISTELIEEELQFAMLSTVAGVPEEIVKNGQYSDVVQARLNKAIEIIKNSKIHVEYNSNFNITEIENLIETNIVKYECKYIFFDYIQITSALAQELIELFGYTLREDQMLNQLSSALKNLANQYDVFILTSTQLNRNHKTDSYVDATHLRGSQGVADKADYVVITLRASKSDLEKLSPITENGFKVQPTHAQHICKNRDGKWTGIVLWVNLDLDTINVQDCFCTTQDFELITTIMPTILK